MLEDVNDEIPLFTEREQETVLEGEPIGTKVTQVNAIDKDGTFPNNQVSLLFVPIGTGVATSIRLRFGIPLIRPIFCYSTEYRILITLRLKTEERNKEKLKQLSCVICY